jgi:hypothetical protein
VYLRHINSVIFSGIVYVISEQDVQHLAASEMIFLRRSSGIQAGVRIPPGVREDMLGVCKI